MNKSIITIHNKSFETFIPKKDIQSTIQKLAVEIDKDYQKEEEIIFLCVLNGAFRFFADLVKYSQLPLKVGFLRLSSYDNTKSTGKVDYNLSLDIDIKNKEIIIVEDIIDTGLTIDTLLNIVSELKPKNIEIASLLWKKEVTQVDISPKYVGFEIPNKFVLGYGLDYDDKGRELNDIYILSE